MMVFFAAFFHSLSVAAICILAGTRDVVYPLGRMSLLRLLQQQLQKGSTGRKGQECEDE